MNIETGGYEAGFDRIDSLEIDKNEGNKTIEQKTVVILG